ncbi:A/G-specific adenine glycosylase [Ectothiorhodospira magna]|uniref:Probable Fe(2+)-trafficking protein n=2 Tax=Ectothiorhodospira magna TaxID=867345 RepID=A0A1H9GP14_9GAMM|nr:A/G-specific adenine glycosylase [Ectothiorhodospira magna]
MSQAQTFATRLLTWFDHHGRHDLPWQQGITPYRVWVSEIMLQQTQVTTVIPYYQRFMARFPDVTTLAQAPIDEVLHHWSGLGYYARARHLHQAAQQVMNHHQGRFPDTPEGLEALPGIGRSTAAAILAIACGQRQAILDGNVKRVLARHRGVSGWPGTTGVSRQLWTLAEAMTPTVRVADYTQAIMDLGATVCIRRRPVCDACPVATDCVALATGRQSLLPTPRPRRAQPLRNTVMLIICGPEGVLLEQRPATGLWGGLWGFPEVSSIQAAPPWCVHHLGIPPDDIHTLASFVHVFTHFRLHITPVQVWVKNPITTVMEAPGRVWYNPQARSALGLAAPVTRLLDHILHKDGEINSMARMVNCVYLGNEAEGLDFAPYPGDLGKRIYDNVSKEAWQKWVRHQTMLINEYRLTPIDPKARKFLEEEMEKFFFSGGATMPEGYVDPNQ